MATIDTIKSALTELEPNINTSAASILGMALDPVAAACDATILEANRLMGVVWEQFASKNITSPQYYVQKLLEWQEGDIFSMTDLMRFQWGYATVNPSIQNCKQAFLNTVQNAIYVNTVDSSGMLTAMTPAQLADISAYFENFRSIGFTFSVASPDPAILQGSMLTVRFRREFSRSQILASIQNRLREFQVTPHFTNEVLINTIESFIKGTDGVVDVYISDPVVTYGGEMYYFINGATTIPSVAINFWADLFAAEPTTLTLIPV
jgi:hypothetical protein